MSTEVYFKFLNRFFVHVENLSVTRNGKDEPTDVLLAWEKTHTSLTICLNGSRDVLAEALVDVEHVEVNPAQLDDEGVSHGLAGSDIGLQDAAQLFHRLRVLQDVHVLRGGGHGQQR